MFAADERWWNSQNARSALARTLAAVVYLLEVMTDPVARSLANASVEDEPVSPEETAAVEVAKTWLENHQPIPHEEVLAEFGLSLEDFERMGRPPLDPHETNR